MKNEEKNEGRKRRKIKWRKKKYNERKNKMKEEKIKWKKKMKKNEDPIRQKKTKQKNNEISYRGQGVDLWGPSAWGPGIHVGWLC